MFSVPNNIDQAIFAEVQQAQAAPAMVSLQHQAAPASVPPGAGNLYVSTGGSDDNGGTMAAPFRTIARAARASRPGTTVHVAPGTYAGGFRTSASGSPTARVTYVSTIRWGAKIVPPANSSSKTAWDNRGSHVDIVGFEVDGLRARGGTQWSHGIYNAGSYAVIRNNWVHHIALDIACTSAGGAAIGVDSYYRGIDSEVIGNLVHDIGPPGCRFVQGIYVSTSAKVKNNVVYRVAGGGIHLWHDANKVIITNNTVTTCTSGIIVGGGDYYYTTGPNNHTVVANNIVYDNKIGIAEQGHTGTDITYANNLVYQNSSYDFSLKNGLTHTGTVAAPPKFAGYTRNATPDLRIGKNSPAVGKGTPVDAAAADFDGRPRNAHTGVDIGAFQHAAAPGRAR
jgi:hypothetical protein